MIWFTSDTHFGHKSMMNFCPDSRKYKNIEEMDQDIISKWNSVVGKHDIVYHLGDFSFYGDRKKNLEIFNSLNGSKTLIIGNHDKQATLSLPWVSVEHYIKLSIASEQTQIIMHHYPILEWDQFYRGSIHLHGHVHGKKIYKGESENWKVMDAGIDGPFNRPFSQDELFYYMKERSNS